MRDRARTLWLAVGLTLAFVLSVAARAQAAPGDFDTSFGTAGLAVNQFAAGAGAVSLATDVALTPEGKILVAGAVSEESGEQVLVARYLPNGTLDSSFGSGGAVVFQPGKGTEPRSAALYSALAVMPDGRIVVAGESTDSKGHSDGFVARLLSDGQLDPSFAGGYVNQQFGESASPYSSLFGLTVEPEGKIVVTGDASNAEGYDEFLAERLGSNGVPDGSFGTAGIYRAQLGSGSVVSGTRVPSSVGSDVIQESDGSFLFSGGASESETNDQFALVKLTPSGKPDLGFGSGGTTLFSPSAFPGTLTAAFRLAEQPGGRIVLGGTAAFNAEGAPAFAVAGFNSDGSIDSSFGTDGATLTEVSPAPEPTAEGVGLVVQANGRIVLPGLVDADGSSDYVFTVVRYTADGALDPSFATEGVLQRQLATTTPESSVDLGATIDSGGQLLVGGADALNGSLAAMLARVQLDTPPTVSFTYPGAGCSSPQPLTFTANAKDSEDPITAVDWDFSGNGLFADAHGTTVTAAPGAITAPGGKVSVRVTNADGLSSTATEPPPPLPPCPPPIPASVKLLGKSFTMDSKGNITLKLSATGALSGTLTLTGLEKSKSKGKSKHKKPKTKEVKLASTHFTATAAGTISLKLHLSASAQKLLRSVSSLKATVTLLTGTGASSQSTMAVTLKASKPKPKHKSAHKRSK